ncbi:Phosphorylated carbohydrates phosphatase [Hordeum vulgare]|nr:Phosphorylated carbohydrates phosphatase [Hordeum vulgare]
MLVKPEEDELLLAWVYHESLRTAETNARRLQQKKAKALRLGIEQSEREAKELVKEKARLMKMKREQDRVVRRINGLIVLSDSDSDDGDKDTSSPDTPPVADDYNYSNDPKGKGPARKWRSAPTPPPTQSLYSFL